MIEAQRGEVGEITNLEEQAISLVGRDIYEALIKGYTEKQWGRSCRELPSFIIRRLPVRYTFDNNYFNDAYQGIAIMNFTDGETPFTRIVEHKHFEMMGDEVYRQPVTVISREYPQEYRPGAEAYYPINDESNSRLYEKYHALTEGENRVIFGGRLAEYKYYDMDDTIARAMMCWDEGGSSYPLFRGL